MNFRVICALFFFFEKLFAEFLQFFLARGSRLFLFIYLLKIRMNGFFFPLSRNTNYYEIRSLFSFLSRIFQISQFADATNQNIARGEEMRVFFFLCITVFRIYDDQENLGFLTSLITSD